MERAVIAECQSIVNDRPLCFSDTCYILSFAIIMLNTSLHNPSVKDKPNLDQFVSMNRGINEGQDLPRELLAVNTTKICPLFFNYM